MADRVFVREEEALNTARPMLYLERMGNEVQVLANIAVGVA
jgi:hypothetical protein